MREYTVEELNIIRGKAVLDGYRLNRSQTGYMYISKSASRYRVRFEHKGTIYENYLDTLEEAVKKRNYICKKLGIDLKKRGVCDISDIKNPDKYLEDFKSSSESVISKEEKVETVKTFGYEGVECSGYRFLSFNGSKYFVLNGGVLGLVSLRDFTQNIPATPVDVLTENPYLDYTDGTTEVFTLGGSSFLIDTSSYVTIKDTVWGHHSGVFTNTDGVNIIDVLGINKSGFVFKNGKSNDFRSCNIGYEERKPYLEIKPVDSAVLCQMPFYVNHSELVKTDALDGTQIDNYLIVSKYKNGQYFARKHTEAGYEMVLVEFCYGVVLEHKLELSVKVPTLNYKDGYSVVFSKGGYPVFIDTVNVPRLKSMFKLVDGDFYYCASKVLVVNDIYDLADGTEVSYIDGHKYNLREDNVRFVHQTDSSNDTSTGVYWDDNRSSYYVRVYNGGVLRYEKGFSDKTDANKCLRKAVQLYG